MPLISQQIPSLLGGVSQQADKQRASSQMEAQLNVYDNITFGKIKRPPTTHVALLAADTWLTPYIFAVDRDATEKYHVIVENGTCFVFDGITGQQYSVLTPQGTSYLGLNPSTTDTLLVKSLDTFAENNVFLQSHISDSGVGWSIPVGKDGTSGLTFVGGAYTFTDKLLLTATSSSHWTGFLYDLMPPVADYMTQINVTAPAGGDTFGATALTLGLRVIDSGVAGTFNNGYFLNLPNINDFTTAWTITKVTSGGSTTLASIANPGNWALGATHTIGFGVVGNVLTAYRDGTSLGTATDSTYAATGMAQLSGHDQGNNGVHWDIQLSQWLLTYTETVTLPNPVQAGFRFTQIQDTTIITNQTVTVETLAGSATQVRYPEALITVAIADYSTSYWVTINSISVGFTTPAPSAPGSRSQLGTDFVAQEIYDALIGNAVLNSQFNFTLLGQEGTVQGASTIYMTGKSNQDFIISGNDSLSDQGLVIVKGVVQAIEYLPARALDGQVVEVQPNPQDKVDAAYYQYVNRGNANLGGEWEECAAPGTLAKLDPMTMPWQLTKSGDVVSGYPAAGPIPTPAVTTGYGSNTYLGPSGTHARGGVIADNAHSLAWVFSATAPYQITFVYDVDVGNLPSGYFIQLVFTNVDSGEVFTFVYEGGVSIPNIVQSFPSATNASSGWTAELFYSTGGTPGSSGTPQLTTAQQGSVSFHSNPAYNGGSGSFGSDYSGLNGQYYAVAKTQVLTWNSQWIYASGVPINIAVVGSTTAVYTPTSNLTATALATALAASLVITGYTFSSTANVLTITKTSGSPGAASVTYTWDNTKQYYNSNLLLAPGSLIGYLFQDLTDGSSALVTANGVSTITFGGGLSGGTTNSIRASDLVAVTGLSGQLYFVLQPINWSPRGAGDDITNPFPSFTYNTINEVGFTSGRLCLFSGENMVCSGSNDVFDVFRTTVTQLLDTDRIDVQGNSAMVSDWYAMIHWAEGVWLFAANVQAQLPTEPALATSTVSIQPLTIYQSQPTLRPLAMDRNIYFTRVRSPHSAQPVTELLRYHRIRFPFQGFIADATTKAIPTYLEGTPTALVGDPVLEILVLLTDAFPNQLYPYIFHYDENMQLQMESWSTWEIDPGAQILAIDFLSGVLGMIVQRSDGVYLEYMDMQAALYEAQS